MIRVPEPVFRAGAPYTRREWRWELACNHLRSRLARGLCADYERLAFRVGRSTSSCVWISSPGWSP